VVVVISPPPLLPETWVDHVTTEPARAKLSRPPVCGTGQIAARISHQQRNQPHHLRFCVTAGRKCELHGQCRSELSGWVTGFWAQETGTPG
jgi:hypothetical protein